MSSFIVAQVLLAGILPALALSSAPKSAIAETLQVAIDRAYRSDPALNALREGVRATGENLPLARSGYHPTIEVRSEAGYRLEHLRESSETGYVDRDRVPYSLVFEAKQPVFDGFRTRYSVRQAVSQDRGARESLRALEQTTLLDAARVYMEVLSNRSLLDHNVGYVEALKKQLGLIRARHEFGDVVGSDVAEVEARLAEAESQTSRALAQLNDSIAAYRQTIGIEPGRLAPARPVDALVSADMAAALELAMKRHPAILAALHEIDAARQQVGIVEAEYYPAVDVVGRTELEGYGNERGTAQYEAMLLAQVRIPLYQGGGVSARKRQAKHVAARRGLESDFIRGQVRAAVATGWSALRDARERVRAARSQVKAATAALEGIRQAYQLGERLNSMVLDAEQDVLDARIGLVLAQRDRVVASYAVAHATGSLDYAALADVLRHQPKGAEDGPGQTVAALPRPAAKPKLRGSIAARDPSCGTCEDYGASPALRPGLAN